ncbi:MAG: tRNA uridine-5-carboxymethylaminomethyl(34) synthesis GTPase MnmE [Alphaproteobacteria bacterium]|nr:tRNA uridine-5-carboxymethylaminomethyl(34) synthesis GTPase MnmE [Alphaproteobacteria bacterium]
MSGDHKRKGLPQQPGIYALATPPGKSALAVIRLSGQGVRRAVEALVGRLPAPRVATVVALAEPALPGPAPDRPDSGTIASSRVRIVDRSLVLWFPAPFSYTGEDGAELHLHGGRATVAAAVAALGRLGLRAAEPGEFTRRAFRNGKMDLTQAEAIADLTEAETAAQRRQALRQMEGALGGRVEGWRKRLIAAMAQVEAALDFADEDLPEGVEARVKTELLLLRNDISDFLGRQGAGERLREGVRVAILGPPNAGKSSLLNALACRDAAIVSAVAGTTRDVIEVHLDLRGVPAILADTAGLREAGDAIEAEGVRRATLWAKGADLKILVGASDDWSALYTPAIRSVVDGTTLVVGNKEDLGPVPPLFDGRPVLPVSVKSGEGMDALIDRLGGEVGRLGAESEEPVVTRARHRQGLLACIESIDRFMTIAETEFKAEELRVSAQALGRISGRIDVEDVLDALFRTFCIGK